MALTTGGAQASVRPRARRPARAASVGSLQAVESTTAVTDAAGGRWTPDPFSSGGSVVRKRGSIGFTSSPQLYRSERVGIRSVSVPLRANGNYLVVLYLAETGGAKPGARVFDVLAQGRGEATVDAAHDVGQRNTYHLAFTVPVSNHRLALTFRALRGAPILSALRVTPVDPSLKLPGGPMVWGDDFNGPAGAPPSPGNWTYDLGPGWDQSADYTSSTQNAALDGQGHLLITARNTPYNDPTWGRTFSITSARLTTSGRFQMQYGTATARAQAANQFGVVSTFWAMGTDVNTVPWPGAGEIDPMEVRGRSPKMLTEAFHLPCGQADCPVVWDRQTGKNLSAGYHTYSFEWGPGVIIYSLDGRQTGSLTSADVGPGGWVFNRPFYLILNLLVGIQGSTWSGYPNASTHWPVTMKVDWVHVQK